MLFLRHITCFLLALTLSLGNGCGWLHGVYQEKNSLLYVFSPIQQPKSLLDCWDIVASSITYKKDLGDHWQTAEETWEKKTGDCEDMNILLTNMLRKNGYEAYLVVGSTDWQWINHAWVCVIIEGEEYYADATMNAPKTYQDLREWQEGKLGIWIERYRLAGNFRAFPDQTSRSN